MEQNDVVKRIREYHIIKGIMKEDSVRRVADDSNMSSLISAYNSYVDFFGKMRISSVETFDQLFSRLEKVYLIDDKHKKVKTSENAYIQYLKDVLGKSGLKQVTETVNNPDNLERIRTFRLDVGKEVRETNSVILARDIKLYSVVAGLRGNLASTQRKNKDLEVELDKVRGILKLTKENAKTKEDVIAELDKIQTEILKEIVENASQSEYLAKSIAKSTGRKINEVRDMLISSSSASARRDAITQGKIDDLHNEMISLTANVYGGEARIRSDIAGLDAKLNGIDGKLDQISDATNKNSKSKAFWKKAGLIAGGFAGGVGVTALVASMLGSGNTPAPQPTPDNGNIDNSAYVEVGYLESVNHLNEILNGYVMDGDFSDEEKAKFEADVDSFVKKYENSSLAEGSQNDAKTLRELANSIYGMSDEKQEALGNALTLNKDLIATKASLETYEKTNTELLSKNSELSASVGNLSNKIDELETKIEELGEIIANTDNAKTIQELQAKIEGYEKQVADLAGQVQTLTGEKTQLETENGNLKTEKTQLEAQVANLTNDNTKLTQDLNKANTDLTTAQTTISTLTAEKNELQAKYDAGQITEKELNEKIQKLEASETSLKSQVESLTKQIATLNNQLNAKISEYNKLVENYNKLDGEKSAIASQLVDAQNKIADLESQLENLTVNSAELVFNIYEYLTGEQTSDIETAMKYVSKTLGITTTTPSTGVEGNVKQP